MVSRLVFTGSIPPFLSKVSEVQHLGKQLWPPDGSRRTEGRLSTSLAAKEFVLSTQQERSFQWIEPSEWWWREEWWTSRESLWLPAIGPWEYPIRDVREQWVWCFLSVCSPALIPVYRKNSCTPLFSGLRSS